MMHAGGFWRAREKRTSSRDKPWLLEGTMKKQLDDSRRKFEKHSTVHERIYKMKKCVILTYTPSSTGLLNAYEIQFLRGGRCFVCCWARQDARTRKTFRIVKQGTVRVTCFRHQHYDARLRELNLLHLFVSYTIKLVNPRCFHVMQSNALNLSV